MLINVKQKISIDVDASTCAQPRKTIDSQHDDVQGDDVRNDDV